MIILTVAFEFRKEVKNYTIPNRADDISNHNSLSYAIGTDYVYNNVYCDSTFQEDSSGHYGEYGTLSITSIDESNKTISGTFEMSLCNGVGYVKLEGKFIDE